MYMNDNTHVACWFLSVCFVCFPLSVLSPIFAVCQKMNLRTCATSIDQPAHPGSLIIVFSDGIRYVLLGCLHSKIMRKTSVHQNYLWLYIWNGYSLVMVSHILQEQIKEVFEDNFEIIFIFRALVQWSVQRIIFLISVPKYKRILIRVASERQF